MHNKYLFDLGDKRLLPSHDKQVLHVRIVPGRVIWMDRVATEVSVDRLCYMREEREPDTSKAPLYTKEGGENNILNFLERGGTTRMRLNGCTRYKGYV